MGSFIRPFPHILAHLCSSIWRSPSPFPRRTSHAQTLPLPVSLHHHFSSKSPYLIHLPTPVPGPPILGVQSQFPGNTPPPRIHPEPSHPTPGSGLLRLCPQPRQLGLDSGRWPPSAPHSPPRSRTEQPSGPRPGGRRTGPAFQAPGGAGAILLCCAGCRGPRAPRGRGLLGSAPSPSRCAGPSGLCPRPVPASAGRARRLSGGA